MSDYYNDLAVDLAEHGVPADRDTAKSYMLSMLFGRVLTARETFVTVRHFTDVSVKLAPAHE